MVTAPGQEPPIPQISPRFTSPSNERDTSSGLAEWLNRDDLGMKSTNQHRERERETPRARVRFCFDDEHSQTFGNLSNTLQRVGRPSMKTSTPCLLHHTTGKYTGYLPHSSQLITLQFVTSQVIKHHIRSHSISQHNFA